MVKLTSQEAERYAYLNLHAPMRELSVDERREYAVLGCKYAEQLKGERIVHMELREKQMAEFLAEKKAWSDAKDAHHLGVAALRSELKLKPDPDVALPTFDAPEPERDFNVWLARKGLS